MQLLLCYDNEGVYVNTYGKVGSSSGMKHVKAHAHYPGVEEHCATVG